MLSSDGGNTSLPYRGGEGGSECLDRGALDALDDVKISMLDILDMVVQVTLEL